MGEKQILLIMNLLLKMRIIFTRHQWRMKVAGAILLMITNSQPISQRTDGTARKGFNDNKIRNSLF